MYVPHNTDSLVPPIPMIERLSHPRLRLMLAWLLMMGLFLVVTLAGCTSVMDVRAGMPLSAGARWVLPTSSIAVRDVFERVVLAGLPQAHWFPVSTLSLPVLKSLLAQPGAVTLAPRSILPALGPGGSAHGVGVLDMALDPAALALAPLGVAYPRQAMPALLREMLAPCGDAGLVAGPDGLVACG